MKADHQHRDVSITVTVQDELSSRKYRETEFQHTCKMYVFSIIVENNCSNSHKTVGATNS